MVFLNNSISYGNNILSLVKRDCFFFPSRNNVAQDRSFVALIFILSRFHIILSLCQVFTTNLKVDRCAELLASVDGVLAQLLFDTEDLVELGETLGTGRSTGLDLTGAETDDDVGNGDVLGLTGAVRDHDTPATGVGVLGGLDGLGEGTDLVDLEQKGVAGLELDGLLDAEGVGDGQVVTNLVSCDTVKSRGVGNSPNNLEVRGLEEVAPSLPVVLSERILNADNGILLGEVLVQVGKLLVGEPLLRVALRVLEVEVVFLDIGLVELAGGNVHGNLDLASVSGLFNGLGDQVESLLGGLDIGSNTTLVTDVTGRLAVLLLGQGLELLVNLGTLAETFAECGSGTINR